MTSPGRAPGARSVLVLDGTATRVPQDADPPEGVSVVLTFWLRFRNDSTETLFDLRPLLTTFTDQSGAALEYDDAPTTVAGSTDSVGPGAGFVTVARHTLAEVRSPRVIRHAILLQARTSGGGAVEHGAGLEVIVDPLGGRTARFTPMVAPSTT